MFWTFLITDWRKWNCYPVTLASISCENALTVSGFFALYCSFCDAYYNCSWFALPTNKNMLIMQPVLIIIIIVLSGGVNYHGVNRRSDNCRRCEPSSVWTVVSVNCRRCELSSVWTGRCEPSWCEPSRCEQSSYRCFNTGNRYCIIDNCC